MATGALLALLLLTASDDEPGSTPRLIASADICADGHTGYLGVHVSSIGEKVTIVAIDPGSPAAQSGLAVGDRIVAIDGATISSAESFDATIAARCPDQKIDVRSLDDFGFRHTQITLTRAQKIGALSVAAEKRTDKPSSTWYGWQVALVDAGAIILFYFGADAEAPALFVLSIGVAGLVPSLIHYSHQNFGQAAGSIGLRVGLGAVSALTLRFIACGDDCDGAENATAAGLISLFGGAVGYGIGALIDIFALSWDREELEATLLPRAATPIKVTPK